MLFEWDENKNKRNRAKHGVGFEAAAFFNWGAALHSPDERNAYGEVRRVALGKIQDRLHVCVYADRGVKRRIISLRKANKREEKLYEKATQALD